MAVSDLDLLAILIVKNIRVFWNVVNLYLMYSPKINLNSDIKEISSHGSED